MINPPVGWNSCTSCLPITSPVEQLHAVIRKQQVEVRRRLVSIPDLFYFGSKIYRANSVKVSTHTRDQKYERSILGHVPCQVPSAAWSSAVISWQAVLYSVHSVLLIICSSYTNIAEESNKLFQGKLETCSFRVKRAVSCSSREVENPVLWGDAPAAHKYRSVNKLFLGRKGTSCF